MIERHLRRLLQTLALVAGVAGSVAFAQTPAPPTGLVPVESFYRHADIASATLSPSGRWLAVRTRLGGERVGIMTFDL